MDAATWAAVSTAGATFLSVLVASVAVIRSKRAWEDQRRPQVVVSVEPSPISIRLLEVVIRNIGPTPARDTKISFTPELQQAADTSYPITKAKPLAEGIALLVPGQVMRLFFDRTVDRHGPRGEGLQSSYTATVEFCDAKGKPCPTAEYVLDVAAQTAMARVEVKTQHDIAVSLEDLTRSLAAIYELLDSEPLGQATRRWIAHQEGPRVVKWIRRFRSLWGQQVGFSAVWASGHRWVKSSCAIRQRTKGKPRSPEGA